ncbi:C40 family peptidase [Kitasatospora sp. NPDC006697]|uniref:C40 family peptidase n=1 Tax=Kitasatospora sp. NPDC006697 TaxID=3364020 RepID=UPI0036931360
MKIATDPALIGFEERIGNLPAPGGCPCGPCRSHASLLALRQQRPSQRAGRIPPLGLAVRSACVATTVLSGAAVLGTGVAMAEPAPSHAGWDGSRYWFRNAAGEWRYTVHYDVYLSRTGQQAQQQQPQPQSAEDDGSGMRQGWDGSRYWFKNEAGEWRYTVHYDVYLSRTGQQAQQQQQQQQQQPQQPQQPQSAEDDGSGMRQGWDGSRYWFKNEAGEWRYTVHYDIYLSRTHQQQQPAPTGTPTPTPASTNSTEPAIAYALAQLGKPYVWGGDGPDGYDCSGLVQQAYRRAGIDLPRVADDQYAATTPISPGRLRRGDLIFWSDSGRASGIHHVAIYLGDNQYVEAPRPGRNVRISTLNSGYYPTHMGRP